tara:strand:+ start:1902 stop:2102 length:201 start_codon:yes stop_codon:yes gene_type:complete
MMILFRILLITVMNGQPVDKQEIAIYEIQSTVEHCEKHIKPAFDRVYVAKDSHRMELRTVTECLKI